MKKLLYIAETNKDGRIACVWVRSGADRTARPFRPKRDVFESSPGVEFSGAARADIESWIAASQADRSRERHAD
ncbi:MAG: hypothetical protein QNJ35_00740 [Paracoccaceae bacterium]|nr:hypothetical protein [Paracoccaceae bacterium]